MCVGRWATPFGRTSTIHSVVMITYVYTHTHIRSSRDENAYLVACQFCFPPSYTCDNCLCQIEKREKRMPVRIDDASVVRGEEGRARTRR